MTCYFVGCLYCSPGIDKMHQYTNQKACCENCVMKSDPMCSSYPLLKLLPTLALGRIVITFF